MLFNRTQAEQARSAGFIPAEPPGRDAGGRYVANAPGSTPGSPTYTGPSMDEIEMKLGNGVSNVAWAMQEYQRLNPGAFLPDSFDKLAQEAHVSRLPFRQYVEAKYDFAGKRAAAAKAQQEQHDARIVKEVEARKDREWAEKVGSNPDVRMSLQNPRMTEIAKAAKSGTLPDPLLLNDQQRRQQTAQMIRSEISENA